MYGSHAKNKWLMQKTLGVCGKQSYQKQIVDVENPWYMGQSYPKQTADAENHLDDICMVNSYSKKVCGLM